MSKHYIWHTDREAFLRKTPRGGDIWTKELRDARYFTSFVSADRNADRLGEDENVIIINHDDAVCMWNGTDNLKEPT